MREITIGFDVDRFANDIYHTSDCSVIVDGEGSQTVCSCDGTRIVEALVAEIKRLRAAYGATSHAIEETLAPALGYEYSEEYGWIVGDHVPETLAAEAAAKIRALQAEVGNEGDVEVEERWGLRVDNRVLEYGYSGYPLRSASEVRSEFDKSLVERGSVVRIRKTITRTVTT